jgi:hypothetical protein
MPPIGDGLRPTVLWNWRVKPPQRRRRRLGIDQNIDAVPAGVRRVSIGAQRRKGVQRAIVCSRKGDLEHIAEVCGDCLTQFIVRLDRPVEPAIAGDSASAATRTCNYPLIVRAERILECPADRGIRPNGAKGKSPLTRRLPPGWVTSLTGMSVTEKNAGSSRKASEMDVSARAAVKSTV